MDSNYVFVACIKEDMKDAQQIFEMLENKGISYRCSQEFLKGDTVLYKKEVYPVIENCEYLIAAISEKSSQNTNMHFEVIIAKESEKEIIPVLLADFDLKKESPCWEYLIGDAKIRKIGNKF